MPKRKQLDVRQLRADRQRIRRRVVESEDFYANYLDELNIDDVGSDLGESDSDASEVLDAEEEIESSDTSEDEHPSQPSTSRARVRFPRIRRSSSGRWRRDAESWKWNEDSFQPKIFSFDRSDGGITDACSITEDSLEYEYFLEFFDNEFMNMIVKETNKYQRYLVATLGEDCPKYIANFKEDVTVEEMFRYITIVMLMAHNKKHRIKDYWTTDEVVETKFIRKLMTRDRFLLVHRLLHFTDNHNLDKNDKLVKIRPVIEHLRKAFKEKFRPFQDLCIDESLMLWRGRLSFRQYIPSKRHRFGVKLFVFCDVESDYMNDFIIYTGGDTEIEHDDALGISGSVVKTFLSDYVNQGRVLYCDNWYSSPKLFKYLYEHNTGACGTARANRKFMPKISVIVNKGESVSRNCDGIMCVKWCDNRVVHMLSSVHEDRWVDCQKRTGEMMKKPACVVEYNQKMRIVDKCDMLISSVECVRKSTRWYIKLFFHLLDMTVLNAYHLFLVKTGKRPPLLDFSLRVIHQLIDKFAIVSARAGPSMPTHLGRLSERHFLAEIPPTQARPNERARLQCHVCANTTKRPKKAQRSYYWCRECKIALCVTQCFTDYHTLLHY